MVLILVFVQFELSLIMCNANNFRSHGAIYQHPLLLSSMLSRCVYVGLLDWLAWLELHSPTVAICMLNSQCPVATQSRNLEASVQEGLMKAHPGQG